MTEKFSANEEDTTVDASMFAKRADEVPGQAAVRTGQSKEDSCVMHISDKDDMFTARGVIFKTNLIRMFDLLDLVGDEGDLALDKQAKPLSMADIVDPVASSRIISQNPHGPVLFRVYAKEEKVQVSACHRRRHWIVNRERTWPPFVEFVRWLLIQPVVNGLINMLLVLDCIIVLGALTELQRESADYDQVMKERRNPSVVTTLCIIDGICLYFFVAVNVLQLFSDFSQLWKSHILLFDVFITALSLIGELMSFRYEAEYTETFSRAVNGFSTMRVLRSLKLVFRYEPTRVLLSSIGQAAKELIFIVAVICIIGYFYAMIPLIFFGYNTRIVAELEEEKLEFPFAYASFSESSKTLFQILTNDHWIALMKEESGFFGAYWLPYTYNISWLLISAYILKNVFIGSLVDNFIGMRDAHEEKLLAEQKREEEEKHINDFLNQQRHLETENITSTVSLGSSVDNRSKQIKSKENSFIVAPFGTANATKDGPYGRVIDDRGTSSPSIHVADTTTDCPSVGRGGREEGGGVGGGGGGGGLKENSSWQPSSAVSSLVSFTPSIIASGAVMSSGGGGTGGLEEDIKTKTERILVNIVRQKQHITWPRDTLLRYLIGMEQLQENLLERERLLHLCRAALLAMHDN